MLNQFTGREAGDHAYVECTLVTHLAHDYQDEDIPPHKQVDVKLPNGKLLRLPYAWLREGGETPAEVLDSMLDASENYDDSEDYGPGPEDVDDSEEYHAQRAPTKRATVKRAAPKQ